MINKIIFSLIIFFCLILPVQADTQFNLSGYVYYEGINNTFYLQYATVTIDSGNSSITNTYGYYNFGQSIVNGSITIYTNRHEFDQNISVVNISGDTEHNISMVLSTAVVGPERLSMGRATPILTLIFAFMCIGFTSRRINK